MYIVICTFYVLILFIFISDFHCEYLKLMRVYSCRGGLDDVGCKLLDVWLREGQSVRSCARRLNVAQATVRRYVLKGPPDHSRRPPTRYRAVLNRRQAIRSIIKHSDDCLSIEDFRRALAPNFLVCKSTVRKDLLAIGYVSRKRPKVVKRYPDDPKIRVLFAKTNRDDPDCCIFSDEKIFDCNDHGHRFQWVRKGESPAGQAYERWSPKVHVWGCIGIGVKKLVFLPAGSITADVYKKHVLIRHVVPMLNASPVRLTFQQDGARAHTANSIKAYLKRKRVDVMENWPPRSPDLNPIENLWARLARDVSRIGACDQDELRDAVQQAWDNIPQADIDVLVRSFKRRKLDVIAARGF